MNFCPNCGTKIVDPELGCPNCRTSTHNTTDKTPNPEYTSPAGEIQPEDINKKGAGRDYNQYPQENKNFSNGLKVLFVTISIIVPVAGIIFGIVAAIILMTNPNKDHKSFGLALLILNIILLVFFLFCCVFTGTSLLNNSTITDEMKENLFDYIENAKTLSILGL